MAAPQEVNKTAAKHNIRNFIILFFIKISKKQAKHIYYEKIRGTKKIIPPPPCSIVPKVYPLVLSNLVEQQMR